MEGVSRFSGGSASTVPRVDAIVWLRVDAWEGDNLLREEVDGYAGRSMISFAIFNCRCTLKEMLTRID